VSEHLARSRRLDVYAAWDEERACPVVVKTLRPDRRAEPELRAALRREGELLRDLAHPHLVRAYAVHDEPRDAVVLETLAGRTVQHALRTAGRLPSAAQVAVLGAQLGGALRFLHRHGVLHLDVKPANVVLGHDGLGRLIDLSHAGPPGSYAPGRGTWSQRSPEQCRGGALTGAADVWGLGILLRELATGVNPLEDLAEAHDTDHPALAGPVPPARADRPRLRRELAGLLDAMLFPVPADRPGLDEVLARLAAVAG
jgi:serine/threonine protein kinase